MTIRTPDSVKVRNDFGFITQDNPFNTKLHDTTDTAINPATEDKQDDLIIQGKAYTTLVDDYTTVDKTYIGKAVAGSPEGGTVWQIKCLDESNNFLKIGFANGVSTFVKEWDNRVGYSYS